jgi:hypothetical protein
MKKGDFEGFWQFWGRSTLGVKDLGLLNVSDLRTMLFWVSQNTIDLEYMACGMQHVVCGIDLEYVACGMRHVSRGHSPLPNNDLI